MKQTTKKKQMKREKRVIGTKRQHEIVVRSFMETGSDPPTGLIEYIDLLERMVLWQDKELTHSRNRKSRKDIYKMLRQAQDQKLLK